MVLELFRKKMGGKAFFGKGKTPFKLAKWFLFFLGGMLFLVGCVIFVAVLIRNKELVQAVDLQALYDLKLPVKEAERLFDSLDYQEKLRILKYVCEKDSFCNEKVLKLIVQFQRPERDVFMVDLFEGIYGHIVQEESFYEKVLRFLLKYFPIFFK